nr:hypothetical protein [uncultured Flavobacterium sp.]
MKTKKEKKEVNKFNLERFEVSKLKNLHLIVGGEDDKKDDPIDGTNAKDGDSSRRCR